MYAAMSLLEPSSCCYPAIVDAEASSGCASLDARFRDLTIYQGAVVFAYLFDFVAFAFR